MSLGMPIVQQVVLRHEGRIWVQNEDGGPAFYIEIPVHLTN